MIFGFVLACAIVRTQTRARPKEGDIKELMPRQRSGTKPRTTETIERKQRSAILAHPSLTRSPSPAVQRRCCFPAALLQALTAADEIKLHHALNGPAIMTYRGIASFAAIGARPRLASLLWQRRHPSGDSRVYVWCLHGALILGFTETAGSISRHPLSHHSNTGSFACWLGWRCLRHFDRFMECRHAYTTTGMTHAMRTLTHGDQIID
jgi:hypothetical protein